MPTLTPLKPLANDRRLTSASASQGLRNFGREVETQANSIDEQADKSYIHFHLSINRPTAFNPPYCTICVRQADNAAAQDTRLVPRPQVRTSGDHAICGLEGAGPRFSPTEDRDLRQAVTEYVGHTSQWRGI